MKVIGCIQPAVLRVDNAKTTHCVSDLSCIRLHLSKSKLLKKSNEPFSQGVDCYVMGKFHMGQAVIPQSLAYICSAVVSQSRSSSFLLII